MRDFMAVAKALADEHRVRMVLALQAGELCVCQITGLFQLAASTVSKHLAVLYQARLVECRKEGRWMYYSLPGKEASKGVREALLWVQRALAGEPCVQDDLERLKRILKLDPSELCKKQCRR
jgi:DNA-binding transcriptional ArsR family regulator